MRLFASLIILCLVLEDHLIDAFLGSLFNFGLNQPPKPPEAPNRYLRRPYHQGAGGRRKPHQQANERIDRRGQTYGREVHVRIPSALDATVDTDTPTLPFKIPVQSNIKPEQFLRWRPNYQMGENFWMGWQLTVLVGILNYAINNGKYCHYRELENSKTVAFTPAEAVYQPQVGERRRQHVQGVRFPNALDSTVRNRQAPRHQFRKPHPQPQQHHHHHQQQQQQHQQQQQQINFQRLVQEKLIERTKAKLQQQQLQQQRLAQQQQGGRLCDERYAQLIGDIFIGNEMVPEILDQVPESLLDLTFRTVRTFPGMRLTADVTRFNPMMRWDAKPDSFYTVIVSNLDINNRRNRTLSEYWHWLVVNVPGGNVDQGQVQLDLLHPLVMPDGDGDHRFGYFVMKQPRGGMDFSSEGDPTSNCSKDMSRGRGPFRSTREFMRKYGLKLAAATFLVIDHNEASDSIACEWQKCMNSEVNGLRCDQDLNDAPKLKTASFTRRRKKEKKRQTFWDFWDI